MNPETPNQCAPGTLDPARELRLLVVRPDEQNQSNAGRRSPPQDGGGGGCLAGLGWLRMRLSLVLTYQSAHGPAIHD